jgi:transposase
MGLNKTEEKEHAKLLYVNERISAKEVAERVKVTQKTIGNWVREGNWDQMRESLLTTRSHLIRQAYAQLHQLNTQIEATDEKVPTYKELQMITQITNNIKKMETETSLSECIEVGKKMITFIQQVDFNDAKKFKNYFDEFINDFLKGI